MKPEETKPEETKPEETKPEETKPEEIEQDKIEDTWGRETSLMTEKNNNKGLSKKEDDLIG
jgi:hypothetical protein